MILPPVLVLCGGQGTRVRDVLPPGQPKALADINGRPFLEMLLTYLGQAGFSRCVLATGYGHEQIEAWRNGWKSPFGRRGLGLLVVRDEGTGTFSAIRSSLPCLTRYGHEQFFVVNGDTYCLPDHLTMLAAHCRTGAWITVAVDDSYESVGTVIIKTDLFEHVPEVRNIEDVFGYLGRHHASRVLWWPAPPCYDIGTPEGLARFRLVTSSWAL